MNENSDRHTPYDDESAEPAAADKRLWWLSRKLVIGIACSFAIVGLTVYLAWDNLRCQDWVWDKPVTKPFTPEIRDEYLPTKEVALTPPEFPGDKVRLKIANETGRNQVVFVFAAEFAFEKPPDDEKSRGGRQFYLKNGEIFQVPGLPGTHGKYLFFLKAKCDSELLFAPPWLDCCSGRFPIVVLRTDENGNYKAELEFEPEEHE